MKNPHKSIILFTTAIVIIMFAFSFALSPLYNVLCKATGLNGKIALIPEQVAIASPELNREITVQFVTTNHANLPWDFYPEKSSVNVHPNQTITVYFFAKNNTDHWMTVRAIPSITPGPAVLHFHKIQCFCFDKQTLAAGEMKKMPVVFRIDEQMPHDMNTISLSYTLFEV